MIGRFPLLLLLLVPAAQPSLRAQQTATREGNFSPAGDRVLRHATLEWASIAEHLPDPATATPAALETAGDILRARRLPEDAIEFYGHALDRGGDPGPLLNRIGITKLELHETDAARLDFRRVLSLNAKNAEAWNNLGAAEYVMGDFHRAITDYHRAIKLNRKEASFHSNLGTAYFELADYESARRQFEAALKIDPEIFQRGGWTGIQAHVLSPKDRGRFCFEMAKLSARRGDADSVVRWLAQSSEAGFDVRNEIHTDPVFEPYRHDERLALLLGNAKTMHAGRVTAAGAVPALPAAGSDRN